MTVKLVSIYTNVIKLSYPIQYLYLICYNNLILIQHFIMSRK